jgi:hypothetical protein
MRASCLLGVLCLFAAGNLAHADDLSTLLHSCGKAASIETHPPSDYDDGAWHRIVEYKAGDGAADWVVVGFTSRSKSGPWAYQDSKFAVDKLACLASSGIVPVRTQAPFTPAVSQSSSDNGSAVFGMLLILTGIFVYFIPTIVASARGCKAKGGIVVVNFFLGWTFIGWVVALTWAACGETKPLPAILR